MSDVRFSVRQHLAPLFSHTRQEGAFWVVFDHVKDRAIGFTKYHADAANICTAMNDFEADIQRATCTQEEAT